jgi:hypothetical protein
VLVWKSIVNWRYMETEMVVSAARLFFRSTSAPSGSFPRIARCHDLRALPEQTVFKLRFFNYRCCRSCSIALQGKQIVFKLRFFNNRCCRSCSTVLKQKQTVFKLCFYQMRQSRIGSKEANGFCRPQFSHLTKNLTFLL